jgi:hypothetical protein
MMRAKYSAFLLLAVIAACGFTREKVDSSEMYVRASALTKLAAAMESYIRYDHPLASLSEAELLAEGTKHNPGLLTNMGEYRIRVLSRDRHAVILMCTKAGDRALLEDAGCTGELEVHHWKNGDVPCEFSVSVASVCTSY